MHGFTLEPSLGEFVLSHDSMKSPDNGKIYSINEGNYYKFDQWVRDYIDECKKKTMTARYIGSLVGDFHRNMLKGGIYLYPNTDKDPNGKLRLLYECNALAFIAEQSGGLATNGQQRILEIQPTEFHQRSPFYLGSKQMVEEVLTFIHADETVAS